MKPIKGYILMHRYREQTRVTRSLIWLTILAGALLAGLLAWRLW